MPRLTHRCDFDVFNPQLHRLIGPGETIDISEDDAEKVNTVSGIWTVARDRPATDERGEERPVVRRGGRRGSGIVEQSGPPPMETR